MKKLLSLILLSQALCAIAADPDLVKGVDFTGLTSVTATKLNQLVDNAYVGTNRGMIIYSATTPDVTETKLKRYLWLDTSVVPPLLKQYNTNTASWAQIAATATVANNSITAAMMTANSVNTSNLIDGAVTAVKIADLTITGSKIAAGTITTTNIAANTITSANISTGGIASASLATGSVTGDKIAAGSVGLSSLTNGFALQGTNIASGTITSTNVATGGLALSNITTNTATSYSSLVFNGSALVYGKPILRYTTNAVFPSSTAGVYTNLAGAGSFTHNLGAAPDYVVVTLVNKANNAGGGYSVGDQISLETISRNSAANAALFTVYSDSSVVDVFANALNAMTYINKAHTAVIDSSWANFIADWNFKVTAVKFNY